MIYRIAPDKPTRQRKEEFHETANQVVVLARHPDCHVLVRSVISPDCLPAQKFEQDAWEKLMLDGRAAFDMRQYAAADRFFSSALFHRDSAGIRDVYLARVLYELAAVRGLTGRHGDAIRLITRAIDVLEALPEVDSATKRRRLERYRREVEAKLHAVTAIAERWAATGQYDTYEYDILGEHSWS